MHHQAIQSPLSAATTTSTSPTTTTQCADIMTPESGNLVQPSSNALHTENLLTEDGVTWSSADNDANPEVKVTVSADNSLVDDVIISGFINVKSVNVTVIDEDGDMVCHIRIYKC